MYFYLPGLSNDILLKFHQNFHSCYHGEDYNVEFTLNRTTMRRSHEAAKFGRTLGKQGKLTVFLK